MELETDILVAGGGLAGVCAAIAAARHGAKVVLVQDRSRLGGNSSSEVKMHVVGADCSGGRPGWRESGLVEELRLDDAFHNPQRSFEMWDLLLYDKVVSEPNIVLLLDSTVTEARMSGNRIQDVLVRCDRTEQLYRIRASIFCDSTGDSRLGVEAGADFRVGREARSEYQESFAPEDADGLTLGSSILFTSRLYRMPMPFEAPKWARKVTANDLEFRKPRSWEYGYWWIAWGGDRNTIRDDQRIRFELLSIVMGVWDYIKNSGAYPDSLNWALDWVGMIPGKRGSRRLLGDTILTQPDLMSGGAFPDAVAIGGWPMDDHPPQGFDRPGAPPNRTLRSPEVFNIPLGSLYSRNIANLMMAGRNISASHIAFTSTRVMATCAVIGQAAGTVAAMCLERGLTPRQLRNDPRQLAALQQKLLRDDQAIQGVLNQDPDDLARQAAISASSQSEAAPAASIIDGHLRDIPAKEGTIVHHWEAPLGGQGAWIELAWSEPVTLASLQIIFDTGFRRTLALTGDDGYNRKMIRGPQPETVRNYTVLGRATATAGWEPLVEVRENHQRLNRHRFAPRPLSAVRIHVHATHGAPVARIFEVRCYS
ncbi:MAG: FAD-dependent oxidoreductase [Acidobacteria bacterium]|nr:FAD-dependent oxidoreductase [Acidobacteriota bacterium]